MRLHTSIALGAIAAVLALPATAEAKAKSHARAAASSAQEAGLTMSEQLQMAQQQLAQMQAQLNAMQARLEQTAAAQTAAADAINANTAATSAAAATATKALASADANKAAVAKTDKAVSAVKWAADTSISGRIYFNVSNINQQANAAGGASVKNIANGTGYNIKRIYLGFDHKFNDMFAMNVTTDISNVVGSTSNGNFIAGTNNLVGKGLYIKQAYLQAKLNPALTLRVGSAQLPWVPYIEGQYGLRHIENVLIDRTGYGTSSDWGIHASGDLADKLISYQVSLVNGGTSRNVKVTKSMDLEGRISIQKHGLWGAVGGYVGKRGNNVQSLTATPTTFYTAKRFDAAVGYKNSQFGLGAEYFYAKNWNNVTSNPALVAQSQDSSNGWSIFGNYNITPKWTAFSKYETIQPNRITNAALRDKYFNIGLQFEPVKIVDLALVYKRETVNNGSLATTNGTIGIAGLGSHGSYSEVGIWGQVRF
ncbi:MAG: hypothetical protein RLY97_1153 [Pseudomonadota bacterium]